ncbi:MAG: hypothetical protein EOP09_01880 [Proteobacteria bacterium]|nr:MAG: hypothetical protein EOP09_01880 [Pseudomonadota bacterium]
MEVGEMFKNASIRYWPDYWLVFAGTVTVLAMGSYIAAGLHPLWISLTFGLFLFGTGAKIAHYLVRDKTSTVNAWFSKWRHSFMADSFAAVGLGVTTASIVGLMINGSELPKG